QVEVAARAGGPGALARRPDARAVRHAGRDADLDLARGGAALALQVDRARGAAQDLLEREVHRALDIGAAGGTRAAEDLLEAAAARGPAARAWGSEPAGPAAEDGAEELGEAAQLLVVEVHDPAAARARPSARRRPEARPVGSQRVVALPLGRVREHLVGLVDLLEPGLGLRVALVHVRVVFAGQLPVGGLDVLGRGR